MMLALGSKFAVYQTKNEIPIGKIIADVEYILESIENKEHHNTIRGKTSNIIWNHYHRTDHQINRKQLILHTAFLKTKLFYPDIIITAADKGNVTIVMERTDYIELLTKHLKDEHKFRPLTQDPTNVLQTKNNDNIRDLFKNRMIDKKTKKRLLTFTAQPPRPRATPKIHKPGLRVIINGTNSPT